MGRVRLRLNDAGVAEIAAAVDLGVAVQELDIRTGLGHADDVGLSRYRREVDGYHDEVGGIVRAPDERHHAALEIAAVDPFEAGVVEVHLVQRRLSRQRVIQVTHPVLDANVLGVLQQMPVEAFVVVPLAPLPELAAHEHELLAGVAVHVAVERAQVRAFLPDVARHLVEHRTLAVHDLVVRERQNEVFGERVEQREGQVVVRPTAVDGIFADVLEHVVHPSHVPLVGEPEAAEMYRPRHARPRRRLFGNRNRSRMLRVRLHVELPQELHRLEVFAAAVLVGQPLPFLPRVVEIQHRRHRVDAESVDVIFVEPEQGAAQEKRAHLVPAVVEDERSPVAVLALPAGPRARRAPCRRSARGRARLSGNVPAPSRE